MWRKAKKITLRCICIICIMRKCTRNSLAYTIKKSTGVISSSHSAIPQLRFVHGKKVTKIKYFQRCSKMKDNKLNVLTPVFQPFSIFQRKQILSNHFGNFFSWINVMIIIAFILHTILSINKIVLSSYSFEIIVWSR